MNNTFFFVTVNYVNIDRSKDYEEITRPMFYKEDLGFILKVTISEEDTKDFINKYIHTENVGYYITVESLKELGVDTEQLAAYANSVIKPDRYWVRIFK